MKIFCEFPTANISKLNFWLVICIAKDFIWTTLKVIFSIFRFLFFLHPQIPDFLNSCISTKYCPILTNHTSMESLFIQLFHKFDPFDCFLVQGHICVCCALAEGISSAGGSVFTGTPAAERLSASLSCCWAQFPIVECCIAFAVMIYSFSLSQWLWVRLDWWSGSATLRTHT